MLPLSLPGGCAGVWRGSNSHFDQACFAAVAGAWCWGVFRLTCVVACCDGLMSRSVSRLAFVVASHAVLTWRAGEGGGLILPALAKSAPTLPSPPRHPGTARCAACGCADRGCQWLFLRLPVWACGDSPLEAGGRATTSARSRRSPATRFQRQRVKKPWIETVGAHGIARARGEPFRQSLLAVCGGRLTP